MSMHVCVYALSCTLSSMSGYIHTHATFKHTHSAMMCVCFTFSISGCCCFVAVLGAAAHTVEAEEEGEVLDRHRCLLALAALRHAKWFQVGTHSLPVFVPDAYCSLTIHPGRIYLQPAHFSVLIIVTRFNRRRHLHFISTNLSLCYNKLRFTFKLVCLIVFVVKYFQPHVSWKWVSVQKNRKATKAILYTCFCFFLAIVWTCLICTVCQSFLLYFSPIPFPIYSPTHLTDSKSGKVGIMTWIKPS